MADDVPEEWVSVVAMALGHTPHNRDTIRSAIAAVAPLIRAAEKDACAAYHDDAEACERVLASHALAQNDKHAAVLHTHLAHEHWLSAAAIRARGADDGR